LAKVNELHEYQHALRNLRAMMNVDVHLSVQRNQRRRFIETQVLYEFLKPACFKNNVTYQEKSFFLAFK
jgi:hypothetical protein